MTAGYGLASARGLTLVEMVVFIAVIGVAGVALLQMFKQTLPRSPTPGQLAQATQLAQERMELILGQRAASGYGAAQLDPCKTGSPTICTNTLGFTVASLGTGTAASSPADPPRAWNGNPVADFKLITVTVSLNSVQLVQDDAVVANY